MGDRAAAAILAFTLFLAPALGATTDELLQDTLKSAVVSIGVLLAAFALLWRRRDALHWHSALLLPLGLMAYALASMAWSHPYLACVEAVRWFVIAVVMFVVMNVDDHERIEWGIAAGAVMASLWAVLQFLFGFDGFPQGAAPGSTFINRNFFAEFGVCALPFTAALLAKSRHVVLLACFAGLQVAALLMAGTRSALLALVLVIAAMFVMVPWRRAVAVLAIAAGIAFIPAADGNAALGRAADRAASISPGDSSLAMRFDMWRATLRMIEAHPLAGVGAGAWENEIPWYQPPTAPVEADYYPHNEFLHLVAEYGVAGWVFLLVLLAWVARRARIDAPTVSLVALGVVSCAGFPLHLAATGALFAVSLGMLAAGGATREFAAPRLAPAALVVCILAAVVISAAAVIAERNLLGAAKLAVSGLKDKERMLGMAATGIALNPHYRKVTPIIADALARQGDWAHAIPIWESVLSSRPNVVAILTNTARGYIATNRPLQAQPYIERARRIQPDAPSVHSAEVLMLIALGRRDEALRKGREALSRGIADKDLEQAVKVLQMSASSG